MNPFFGGSVRTGSLKARLAANPLRWLKPVEERVREPARFVSLFKFGVPAPV
jgi:hypothetical protein